MRIEHIAMYVSELEEAKYFFEKYFDAVPGNKYHNPVTDFTSYFLTFADGTRLEIMNRPNLTENPNRAYVCGYTHIAFSVGSREKVDELTKQLASDGYVVVSEPRVTGDRYYESCVIGLENNLIEITE